MQKKRKKHNLIIFVYLEAVDDEVGGAVGGDEEVGDGHDDLVAVTPRRRTS